MFWRTTSSSVLQKVFLSNWWYCWNIFILCVCYVWVLCIDSGANISVLVSREESCAYQFLASIYFWLLSWYFHGLDYVQTKGVVVVVQDAEFYFGSRMMGGSHGSRCRMPMIVIVVWLHTCVLGLCHADFTSSFLRNCGCRLSTLLHRPWTISGIDLPLDLPCFYNNLLSVIWVFFVISRIVGSRLFTRRTGI